MTSTAIVDLAIAHLEYVFDPPGLPLPRKDLGEYGTTSVLVQGGPGTGKTSLALGLAHAIAKQHGGVALYLTTEFSSVELTFKAKLLRIAESAVHAWPGKDVASGHVVVQSLAAVAGLAADMDSAELRRATIDAVWGQLHPDDSDADANHAQPTLPVRAIVIDALTLPDSSDNRSSHRADLVAFIQALEAEGRSVVLVEEQMPEVPAWTAFVVDVVFELGLVADPETHDLRRKLTLSKCRHALSIPGPHDYGLEGGRLAVWPDLFRVVTGTHGVPPGLPRTVAPPIWIPVSVENMWQVLGASIVLSSYETSGAKAMAALSRTPGTRITRIEGGARTQVGPSQFGWRAFDYEGPHAIAWLMLAMHPQFDFNVCWVQNASAFLDRRSAASGLHVLVALRELGWLVCVHGSSTEVDTLLPEAVYRWGGRYTGTRRPLRPRLPTTRALLTRAPERSPATAAAWQQLIEGNRWAAARAALDAMERETEPDIEMSLLWKAVCACVAHNQAAIGELVAVIGTPHEILVIDPLLCALVAVGQLDEAGRIAAEVAQRYTDHPDPFFAMRPLLEAQLAADDRDLVRSAMLQYSRLALPTVAAVPLATQVELAFNLGTAARYLGDRSAAEQHLRRAVALDPSFAPATRELERLAQPMADID